MPHQPPSRSALRYLTRLCQTPNSHGNTMLTRPARKHVSTVSTSSRRSISSSSSIQHRQSSTLGHYHNHHRQPPCPKTSGSAATAAAVSNTSRHYHSTPTAKADAIQPEREDPDPQNQVTSQLPDITNFYTLFPKTLPDGPPRPTPLVQQADTSFSSSSSSPSSTPHHQSTNAFDINLPDLRREFLQLQSTHHPDKYPTSTPAHQKALALSSLINNAYKTLSDPLLRAQYLLELVYEVDVTSEDNSAYPTDQETLMEVMEVQEQVEEATSQAEVDALKEENQARVRVTGRKVGEAFVKGDKQGAIGETVRLKYWRSLQQGLDDWEPGKEVRLIH